MYSIRRYASTVGGKMSECRQSYNIANQFLLHCYFVTRRVCVCVCVCACADGSMVKVRRF